LGESDIESIPVTYQYIIRIFNHNLKINKLEFSVKLPAIKSPPNEFVAVITQTKTSKPTNNPSTNKNKFS